MQHLEIVTRHAIFAGSKEDIVSGFSPSLITIGFLQAAFSQDGLSSGVSEMVLSLIERDHIAARSTNQLLLRHGDELCQSVDPHCLKRLLSIVKGHLGLGKGAFFAALKHMPEDFAVVQLNQWIRDGSMRGIELKLIESVLDHSLSKARYHVAHAMCGQMKSRGAESEMQRSLVAVPYPQLEAAALDKYVSQRRVVEMFCDLKAFQQAQVAAGNDSDLNQILRDSIGKHLKLKDPSSNWVELFAKLTERMDEVVDQQLLIDRHKSAAIVILNKIVSLDAHEINQQINTDRLRIFAYQLGLTDVLGSLQTSSARDSAFAMDLGL